MLEIAETATPIPGPREVLIEVEYAGVNRPDILQRSGTYPPPPGASPILGLEVSGHVVARGAEVNEWTVGDSVCALTPGGGYAEYCLADASHCLAVPRGLESKQAAALPENLFTVWHNLIERGRLKAGETVLVHGGSSGIGYMAIQLAKQYKAEVLATAGSDEKAEFCRKLGAIWSSTTEPRTSSLRSRTIPASMESMSSSTWSEATICEGTSGCSPSRVGWFKSRFCRAARFLNSTFCL